MQRILAHKIICNGKESIMSIVTIDDDNCLVSVEPFTHETEGTRFISGSIVITTDSTGHITSFEY